MAESLVIDDGNDYDPNEPQHFRVAIEFFAWEYRAQHRRSPDRNSLEHVREMRRAWKGMTKEEKRPYKERAARDMQRYLREMETYSCPPQHFVPNEALYRECIASDMQYCRAYIAQHLPHDEHPL